MRSELEQLEQIDQYLAGKMSPDQAAAFEAQMNADPALKSMVQDQQLLIQTVSRTAMMAEIKAVAGIAAGAAAGGGAASAGWGLTQWIIVGITAVGATVGGVAIYNSVTDDQETEVVEETVNSEDNNEAFIASETFDTTEMYSFQMVVDKDDEDEDNSEDLANSEVEMIDINVNNESDQSLNESENSNDDPLNEFSNLSSNQSDENNEHIAEYDETDTESLIVKNRKAAFNGGHSALKAHFKKNLTYPGTAMKEKVQGTVIVTIVIKIDGTIEVIGSEMRALYDENGKLLTGLQRARHRKAIKKFEGNAERAFRICPNWVPATNTSGSPRQSTQKWGVKFNLYENSEVWKLNEDSGSRQPNIGSEGVHDYSDSDVYFEVQPNQYDLSEPTNK